MAEAFCNTFWRSHGCDLQPGHDGDHICGPCPADCDGPIDEEWFDDDGVAACSVHCGDRPTADDRLFSIDRAT